MSQASEEVGTQTDGPFVHAASTQTGSYGMKSVGVGAYLQSADCGVSTSDSGHGMVDSSTLTSPTKQTPVYHSFQQLSAIQHDHCYSAEVVECPETAELVEVLAPTESSSSSYSPAFSPTSDTSDSLYEPEWEEAESDFSSHDDIETTSIVNKFYIIHHDCLDVVVCCQQWW